MTKHQQPSAAFKALDAWREKDANISVAKNYGDGVTMKRRTFVAALITAALGLASCGPAMADLVQSSGRLTSVDSRQLDGLLIGKTKEQVRTLLGKPSTHYGEFWYYWPSKLAVYDAEEGAYSSGSLMIRFDTTYYGAAVGYEVQQ